MTRGRAAWAAFFATRAAGLAADAAALGLSHLAAYALRFDFSAPRWGWRAVAVSFLPVCFTHLAMLVACGCYRKPWRKTTLADAPRYALACAIACAALLAMRSATPVDIFASVRPPYTVTLMTAIFSAFGVFCWRVAWNRAARMRPAPDALLERSVRRLDRTAAAKFLGGKTVMVTGAGGSIGSELVRQAAAAGPAEILLVERCENALYEIDREMRGIGPTCRIVPLMLDIADIEGMEAVFAKHRPQVVLHAAAYKHVPMVELNPREGWRNNAEGTRILAKMAAAAGVERFVLVSTDKAVNPVSEMGKSKREAEKIVLAMNGGGGTSFCAVRFGNVLGSSGSVVPLFREQIERGGPVTVTHPDMKRYFMTAEEAAGLVLQAAARSEKAIYTLDMGEPVAIVDLAEEMIRQAGYKPYVDIPIVFTGARPGEKLFEELDVSEKSATGTDMARIYVTKRPGD